MFCGVVIDDKKGHFNNEGMDVFSKKSKKIVVALGAALASNSALAVLTPDQVYDAAWDQRTGSCAGAVIGTEFSDRCIAAAAGNDTGGASPGNNGGVFSGVGNSSTYAERKIVSDRLKKLKERGGASGDTFSGERLGYFVSGKLTETERIDTTLETGYELDEHGVTGGMDYVFSDKFVAGFAIAYSDTDLDYNKGTGGADSAGSSDYENISFLTYANYSVNDSFGIDGYVGWSGIDYDLKRNIKYTANGDNVDTTAVAEAEANKVLAGLNFIYNLSYDALLLSPMIKLDYSGTFIDQYSESQGAGLNLKYQSQNIQSFKSTLGFDVSYAVSMPWGVLLPKIKAGYVHEFLDQRRTIHASFVQDTTNYDLQFSTDKPDRDYFIVGGGLSTVLAHSVQLFVDYERIEGHRYLNSYTVSGGVRIAF